MMKLIPVDLEQRVTERRTSPRLRPDSGTVAVTLTTPDGKLQNAVMKDISARGVRVKGPVQACADERIKLAISLKDDVAPYEVDAVVVHRTEQCAGLRFVI